MNVQQIKSKVKVKNLHRNSRTKTKSRHSSVMDSEIYPMKTFLKLTFNNGCLLYLRPEAKNRRYNGTSITGIQVGFMQAISTNFS